MKIVFDDETQMGRIIHNRCPSHFVKELERRCDKECYIIRNVDKSCEECWKKFDEYIQIEVKNNERN